MRTFFVNLALLSGIIGFAGYLFLILAGYIGCCRGFTTLFYHKVVLLILSLSVVIFVVCMLNNCCKKREPKS